MARAWFLRVLLNSSSFSAILRSISCLTWPSSSWALSTLFSSASREPSASLKGRLQLLLLALHAPPLFVKLMDGAAAIAKLIEQVLDLVGEVLVFTADNVQLLVGLIEGRLEAEPLVAVVASLRVGGIQLGHKV